MTPEQINLVQSSFSKVAPVADAAAKIFYARLFEIAPHVKPLFRTELTEQGKKLMQMLTVAVKGLDKLGELVPAVQQLGARHADYGVTDEHYDTVADAFIFTLEKGLGDELTDEVKAAWLTVYTVLADTMKAAAADAGAAAPGPDNVKKKSDGPGASVGIAAAAVMMAAVLLAGFL